MRKLLAVLFISTLVFTACEGDQGPPGPEGPAGEDGDGLLGYTYEETVDFEYFEEDNLYGTVIGIPDDVATPEPVSDAVLVYRLEIQEDDDGEFDTWSLLPQNFFLDEGTIQYVFNHTDIDVEILIDGDFDLSGLDAGFTNGQTFRIVVLPSASFAQENNVDISNYSDVMEALDFHDVQMQHIQ